MKLASLAILLTLDMTPGLANAADAVAGKTLFQEKCQSCHGPDGQGKAALAKMLKVTMNPLGSAEVQKMTDEQLEKIVTTGKDKMPPVRNLSKTEVDNVIAFVRTLAKK